MWVKDFKQREKVRDANRQRCRSAVWGNKQRRPVEPRSLETGHRYMFKSQTVDEIEI